MKNDGTDKTLVVLDGTIPMFHNQKKYNCPVRFWLVLDYPMSPPICYVSPTRDMGIKPTPRARRQCGLHLSSVPYAVECALHAQGPLQHSHNCLQQGPASLCKTTGWASHAPAASAGYPAAAASAAATATATTTATAFPPEHPRNFKCPKGGDARFAKLREMV